MFRLFASSFKRTARPLFNATSTQRFTLKTVTYAQSKAWKTDVHQTKPVSTPSQSTSTSSEENRVVIVRGLPQNWADKDITAYFDQATNKIQRVNLIKNKAGENTGKALITLSSGENAESFISTWNSNTVKSGELNQVIAAQLFTLQKKEEAPAPEARSDLDTVFVSNLAYNCTSDDLHNLAVDFGEIVGIDAPMTANNKTKGFAFITFKEASEAQKFLNFVHEKDLKGRKLKAQLSRPRNEGKTARKPGQSNFNFSKAETEEIIRRDDLSENLSLYRQLVSGSARPLGGRVVVGKSIKMVDTGNGFDF